ncbi:MAG: hemerythrin domain-containing protein [Burkholderiales bacterium]
MALPGFDSPAVGFEQPFEMLEACHQRVRRSLALLDRLIGHIGAHGHDAQSRSAAADVLRYFDLAAPQHHLDEERHVFPMLDLPSDTALQTVVDGLRGDHARMEALWAHLGAALSVWALPVASGDVDPELRRDVREFAQLYDTHLRAEESIVFPAARSRMSAARLAQMSADMQRRRRAGPPA